MAEDRDAVARQARLALPAAATAALCFSAGGFFPGATAVAAIAVLVALLLRITLARHPWEGWSAGMWDGSRRARAVRGLDPGVGALVRRARPRAARIRPHAALPRGVRRVRAVRRARRGPGRRPALDRGGGLRRLHRRAGDPARPRDVPDRPAAQPHAARVPAHLLEQPSARSPHVGLVLALHVTSSIRQPRGRARARRGGRSRPSPSALYFTFSRGGSIAAVFGVAVYLRARLLARVRAGLHRGGPDDRLRAPARVRRRSAAPGRALRAAAWPPRSAATCSRSWSPARVAAGAAARALLLLAGPPAGAHAALAPRAAGRQARRRRSLVAVRRRRSPWRAACPRRVERRAPSADRPRQPAVRGGDLRTHLTTWDDNCRIRALARRARRVQGRPAARLGRGDLPARRGSATRPSQFKVRRRPLALLRGRCPSWAGRGCCSSGSRSATPFAFGARAASAAPERHAYAAFVAAGGDAAARTRGSTGTGRCRRCSCGSSARAGWCSRAGAAGPRRRRRG